MIKVYLKFKALAIRVALEYKANFWMMTVSGIAMRGIFYLAVMILYNNLPDIAGWRAGELYLIMSYLFLSEGLCTIMFDGVWHLSRLVATGTFDVMLARPVSPLYQLLSDQIGLQGFGIIPLGLVTFVMSMLTLQWLTPLNILLSLLFLACGVVLRMSSTLLFVSAIFYVPPGSNLNVSFLAHSVGEYARYPLNIYPFWMRAILLFVIPMAFAGYVPTLILRDMNLWLLLALPVMTLVYFLVARAVFYRGIRRYESMGM